MGMDMYIYIVKPGKAWKDKEEIEYWRKLYPLHNWMFRNVRNIHDGRESIFKAKITPNDLSRAAKYMASLKRQKGYWNDYYYSDVPKRLRCIRNAMKLLPDHQFFYHADW